MRPPKFRRVLIAAASLQIASTARADAGVPMLAVAWPAAWMVLLPVIAIEWIAARAVLRVPWQRALEVSAAANGLSTLVGIPLAWIVTFTMTAIPAYAADSLLRPEIAFYFATPAAVTWLPPISKTTAWMIPAALAFLCIPFLLASVWIEASVARKMLPDAEVSVIRCWAWRANLASYGAIVLCLVGNAVVLYTRSGG
jgi:hypothetical protein